jgi:hypothetical protein
MGHGKRTIVGKGEERLTDSQGLNEFSGFSVKEEGRLAHGIVHHLHVGPTDSLAKSKSNGFEKSLFGCKSNGVTFSRARLSLAASDLFFGEDTTDEEVTPSGDEAVDPFDMDNIDARADNHGFMFEDAGLTLSFRTLSLKLEA